MYNMYLYRDFLSSCNMESLCVRAVIAGKSSKMPILVAPGSAGLELLRTRYLPQF